MFLQVERNVVILVLILMTFHLQNGRTPQFWAPVARAAPSRAGYRRTRVHGEGLAQRGPETSQPVMGLRFGNKIEAWGHRRR